MGMRGGGREEGRGRAREGWEERVERKGRNDGK